MSYNAGTTVDRVYLDNCCYKRPFDDQGQDRIRVEADVVGWIVERAERGEIELVRSPALRLENDRNPREDRRLAAALWIDGAVFEVAYSDAVRERADDLHARGFGVLDAFHVAYAEAAKARWMVTCDDDLLALARRQASSLAVLVASPLDASGEMGRP